MSAKNSGRLGRATENLAKNTLPNVPVPKKHKSTLCPLTFPVWGEGGRHTDSLYKGEILHVPGSMIVVLVSGMVVIDMHSVVAA